MEKLSILIAEDDAWYAEFIKQAHISGGARYTFFARALIVV